MALIIYLVPGIYLVPDAWHTFEGFLACFVEKYTLVISYIQCRQPDVFLWCRSVKKGGGIQECGLKYVSVGVSETYTHETPFNLSIRD